MRWLSDHKGNITFAAVAIIVGVFMGLLLYAWLHDAQAVIGGVGNLTHSSNKHNLSASATHGGIKAVDETRICVFCHTPHHAITDDALINGPLWNHTLSTASYDLSKLPSYFVNTDTVTVDGASKMCMSCHDGTVGVGMTGTLGNIAMVDPDTCLDSADRMTSACAGYLGTTPEHHIFSVPMNKALLDDSLYNCTGPFPPKTTRVKYPWMDTATAPANDKVLLRPTKNTYGGSPGVSYPDTFSGMPATSYPSGYNFGVQCSSCHDPHLYREVASVNCKFLVDGCTDYTDPICLACHTMDCP